MSYLRKNNLDARVFTQNDIRFDSEEERSRSGAITHPLRRDRKGWGTRFCGASWRLIRQVLFAVVVKAWVGDEISAFDVAEIVFDDVHG
jgi:hypothetical protein